MFKMFDLLKLVFVIIFKIIANKFFNKNFVVSKYEITKVLFLVVVLVGIMTSTTIMWIFKIVDTYMTIMSYYGHAKKGPEYKEVAVKTVKAMLHKLADRI